jgi:hypothetical protein
LLSGHCLRYRTSQSARSVARSRADGSATHERCSRRVLLSRCRAAAEGLSAASRGAVAACEQLAGAGSGDGARFGILGVPAEKRR